MIKKIALCIAGFMALQLQPSTASNTDIQAMIRIILAAHLNIAAQQNDIVKSAMRAAIANKALIAEYEALIRAEAPEYFGKKLNSDEIKMLESTILKRIQRDFGAEITCDRAVRIYAEGFTQNADWLIEDKLKGIHEKSDALEIHLDYCKNTYRNYFKRDSNRNLDPKLVSLMLEMIKLEQDLKSGYWN